MKRVIIESPFGTRPDGSRVTEEEFERNVKYAWEAVRDSLRRGEAPFASHLFYPGVLDDLNPDERQLGINAGLAWGKAAEATVVYQDYGITEGMKVGIATAELEGRPVLYRSLRKWEVEP